MAHVFHSQSSHLYNDNAKVRNKNDTTKFPPFIRSQISHDFRTNFKITLINPNGRSYGRSMGGLTGGLTGGLENTKSLIHNELTRKTGGLAKIHKTHAFRIANHIFFTAKHIVYDLYYWHLLYYLALKHLSSDVSNSIVYALRT